MIFNCRDTSLISDDIITTAAPPLVEYAAALRTIVYGGLYDDPESSINLPSDETIMHTVENAAQKVKNDNLKYIIDIGIGGSNLGTKAIYDALFGFFDLVEPERYPKMYFADTSNPELLYRLGAFLETHTSSPEEFVINVISKSGSTTETIANFEILFGSLWKKYKDIQKRVIVTTDENSKLWITAKDKHINTLPIPKVVGGRYSVLSSVGLLPLTLVGIDAKALLKGALHARENGILTDVHTNRAMLSAIVLYENMKRGKIINDNFFFHGELESLGKWYRQLMGESIGKDGKGITPTVSIGSTDLHSVAQLYYGGPRDKITTLVWSHNMHYDVTVPVSPIFTNLVPHIANKQASQIMKAIIEGVKISYKNEGMPYMEIVLNGIHEESLGEYLQFKMLEMMYLGKLLDVNAFNQPHVEIYKTEMKKVLKATP